MSLNPPSRNTASRAAQRGRQGLGELEIALDDLDPAGIRADAASAVAHDGASGQATPGQRVHDLAADVAGRSGHRDHASSRSTRLSPPLTSSTTPVVCGLVIRKRAA